MNQRFPVLMLSLLPLAGCAAGAHKRLDGPAFARMCAAAEPATVRTTTWIGRTSDRAYIEVWHGGPWWLGGGIDVCSVLLADLPTPVREAVLRGEDPTALPREVLTPAPAQAQEPASR
jgi:hypothetical protein